jgi:imidazolonepropionase-like amidohydrolase
MAETVDRLFVHCKELVTLTDGPPTRARRGEAMLALGVIEDGAVAVRDGRIVATGPTDRIGRDYRAAVELDLGGHVVLPGFVDAHTHPVFARTREHEFHLRCAGADYMAIAAAGGLTAAFRAAQAVGTRASFIQVEVETLRQLQEALDAGVTMVLLDNMPLETIREAVRMAGGRCSLEISGGVTFETLRACAETGVDRISVGALIKDVKAVDFSMRFTERPVEAAAGGAG